MAFYALLPPTLASIAEKLSMATFQLFQNYEPKHGRSKSFHQKRRGPKEQRKKIKKEKRKKKRDFAKFRRLGVNVKIQKSTEDEHEEER